MNYLNGQNEWGLVFDDSHDTDPPDNRLFCWTDAAAYGAYGIPAITLSAGLYQDYRTVSDDAAHLDYPRYTQIVRFAAALALTIANAPARPAPSPSSERPRCK